MLQIPIFPHPPTPVDVGGKKLRSYKFGDERMNAAEHGQRAEQRRAESEGWRRLQGSREWKQR